ncbi:hypothetical protein ILUMI_05235, partial [Ignelater luminosus]
TVQDWTLRDKRIMAVHLNIGSELLSLVIAHGPNEDERAETEDEFYEALQRELDDAEGKINLLGDLYALKCSGKSRTPAQRTDLTKEKATRRKIKIRKLKIEDKQNEYQKKIEKKSTQVLSAHEETANLEESWHKFKTIILESVEEVCDTIKGGGKSNKKMTRWWNEEVKEELSWKRGSESGTH